ELTHIDPWFLDQLADIVKLEDELRVIGDLQKVDPPTLRKAKQYGFSDRQLATLWQTSEISVREHRKSRGSVPTYKSVDTCAAELEAYTAYYYSTYEDEDETPAKQPGNKRMKHLGGG